VPPPDAPATVGGDDDSGTVDGKEDILAEVHLAQKPSKPYTECVWYQLLILLVKFPRSPTRLGPCHDAFTFPTSLP